MVLIASGSIFSEISADGSDVPIIVNFWLVAPVLSVNGLTVKEGLMIAGVGVGIGVGESSMRIVGVGVRVAESDAMGVAVTVAIGEGEIYIPAPPIGAFDGVAVTMTLGHTQFDDRRHLVFLHMATGWLFT